MQNILIKDPAQCVLHSIESLSLSYPSLTQLSINSVPLPVILRSDWCPSLRSSHIALITGGGAGHEPAHSHYVGSGMLTAAISGQIFSSPSVQIINDTIEALVDKEGPGCLLIVKNYTGDRLNFGLALEQCKAKGYKLRLLIVEDDCSIDKEKGVTGRRGLAGTVLIHKIAGAICEEKAGKITLDELFMRLTNILEKIRTIGVAFSSCAIPGRMKENRIKEGYVELGLGIHNEPGVETLEYQDLSHLVSRMMEKLLKEFGKNEGNFIVLINNLGCCTYMEMGLITREVFVYFELFLKKKPIRVYSGAYMTSFDMKGFSVTLLQTDEAHKQEFIRYFDHPVNALAWSNFRYESNDVYDKTFNYSKNVENTIKYNEKEPIKNELGFIIERIAIKLLEKEKNLNELDGKVGDGDCGLTFALGANRLIKDLPRYPLDSVSETLKSITKSIETSMGGTSGVIYRIFFTSFAHNYEKNLKENAIFRWKIALEKALESLLIYDKAREGHRTMLDALIPAIKAFGEITDKNPEDYGVLLKEIRDSAIKGAENTKNMKAAAGRSNYVPDEILKNYEDPGARAIAYIFEGIYEGFTLYKK